jgi:hypothetical protein
MFSVKPTAFQVSQAGTSLQGVCTTFVKVGQNVTNICLKLKVKVGIDKRDSSGDYNASMHLSATSILGLKWWINNMRLQLNRL